MLNCLATIMPTSDPGPVGPLFIILVLAVALLILIGVGFALGAAIITTVACLIFMGIVSTSILIGLKDKRLESSARAFVVQLAALLGAMGGGVIFFVASALMKLHLPMRTAVIAGIICGIAGGIAVGFILDLVWRRVRAWIIAKKSRVNAS